MSTTWTTEELDRIGTSDEMSIAALREDGSLRSPTTIWVVRDGDDLYVRSFRGSQGGWYQGTKVRHEGHIRAGGLDKDVTFVDVIDPDVNARIDEAYRIKYHDHGAQYVDPMVAASARATTTKLVPAL